MEHLYWKRLNGTGFYFINRLLRPHNYYNIVAKAARMQEIYRQEALRIIAQLDDLKLRFNGKTIVLTGATGFLGANFLHLFAVLNDEVLDTPCHVFAYDNLIRGKPNWLDSLCAGRDDITFETKDVAVFTNYPTCDHIIHCASIASPIMYRKHPIETMDTNVLGIRNILEFAKTQSVESILFLSSSEIYGNPPDDQIPTSEDFDGLVSCTGPRSCYDESKRYGETLCVFFHKQFDVPVKTVRPFNVYGTGLAANDGRVISDFFRDSIEKGQIALLSDGLATRTFCYITDAINGFIRVLLNGKNGQAYNIGNERPEINMRDLADKINQLAGNSKPVTFETSEDADYTTDNPSRRCPSIHKARTELGYEPAIELDSGLELTYEFYKSQL